MTSKTFARVRRVLDLIGAYGAMVASVEVVREHGASSLRYLEALPLFIAFVLLLTDFMHPRGSRSSDDPDSVKRDER
jgi:hypothetical protein